MHSLCTVSYWVTEPSSCLAIEDKAKYRDGLFVNLNPQSIILFIRTTEGKMEAEARENVWCYVTKSSISLFTYSFVSQSQFGVEMKVDSIRTHTFCSVMFLLVKGWKLLLCNIYIFNWLPFTYCRISKQELGQQDAILMSASAVKSPQFPLAEDVASHSEPN